MMTDRSSEERSREWTWSFLKVPRKNALLEGGVVVGFAITHADAERICEAMNSVAALEDRQEAAPEVGLRIDNLINYAANLQSDTIYLDPDDIAFIHEYYGCKTGCCTKFAGKIMKPKVGVPSEATPSKENAPPECPEREIPRAKDSRLRGKKYLYPEAAPAKCEHDPEDRDSIGCAWCDSKNAAPAPEVQGTPKFNLETTLAALQAEQDKFAAEHPDIVAAASARGTDGGSGMAAQNSAVQGTPTKYPFPKNPCGKAIYGEGIVRHCWLEVDHEVECRWIPVSQIIPPAPVGTPQKETRAAQQIVKDAFDELTLERREKIMAEVDAKFDRPTMPYGAGAQNVGAVPEGVQGKEPQDFPLWERACDCCLIDGPPSLSASGKWTHYYDNGAAYEPCTAGRVFASGEAAGRRSEITEIQETVADCGRRSRDASFVEACDWCLKKCAELQEKTK